MNAGAVIADGVPVDSILALLTQARLPVADIAPGPRQRFLGARDAERWIGIVAIEPLGDAALLRSLAVAPEARSHGVARRLVFAAEALARSLGAREIVLLTTGAAGHFERLGYAPIARDQAPEAVRASTQFASICPASATVMRKRIAG